MTIHSPPARTSPWLHAAFAVAAVALAAVAGAWFTFPNLPWYATLAKPWFSPPNAVFGPVWNVLYALMAYAFWRILRAAPRARRSTAAALFLLQLVFNAAWPLAFFGLNSPAAGMIVIVILLGLIGLTMAAFAAVDRPAAWLLAPYLAWVSFATVLNFAIWTLN